MKLHSRFSRFRKESPTSITKSSCRQFVMQAEKNQENPAIQEDILHGTVPMRCQRMPLGRENIPQIFFFALMRGMGCKSTCSQWWFRTERS